MAKIVRAIKPNAGIQAAYRKRLRGLVEEMRRSVIWWVRAAYREVEPRVEADLGLDARPGGRMARVLARLRAYWQGRWDREAERIARAFIGGARRKTRSSLKQALKAVGFSVKMDATRATEDIAQALILENVGLIKSIPEKCLSEVEGLVMRSVTTGRDVGGLVDELERRFEVTRNRADLIARDQNNKATQAMQRVESERLGIKVGIWVHIPGKHTSRATHKAMHGKPFLIAEGLYDSKVKRKVKPGELVACQCVYRQFVPELGDKVTPEIEQLLRKAG